MRKGGKVVVAGDGQVSLGATVIKANARKVRSLGKGDVIGGFAGATADAFTLFERLENKLEQYPGQLTRACVELAKDWRTDRFLRRLEAMMIVADKRTTLVLTGTGDVLEPEAGVMGIGSGGNYALAAAKALMDSRLDAEEIARKAMHIAAEICVYTNGNLVIEALESAMMSVRASSATYGTPIRSTGGVADLALLRTWLERPHMREWWGEPEAELGYIRDMIEGRDTTRPFIFSVDGEPVGYIQYWLIGHHQNATWIADHPWLAELPPDAVGVDLSIGDPGKLSQGIGSGVLRAFAERLVGAGPPDHHHRPRSGQRPRGAGLRESRLPCHSAACRAAPATPSSCSINQTTPIPTDPCQTFSPREIVSELDRFIVGQKDAKRAVAIALRNRWRRQQLPDDLKEEVLPKNILMIGPTGVRQDRDLPPARAAGRRTVHEGGGHQVHRGRLRRPRRRLHRARPGRGRHRPGARDQAARGQGAGREERRGARAGRPGRGRLFARHARELPQAAAQQRAERQGDRDPGRRQRRRSCRPSTSPAARSACST